MFLIKRAYSLTEAVTTWTCRRTARREDVQRNVMRGGGSSCESNWRIYFFCVGRLQDTSVLLEAPITSTPPPLQTATLSLNADSLLLFKGIHPHRFTHSHSAAAKLNLHLSSVTHISGTLLLFRCEKDESSGGRVALCQQVKRIRKFHF